MKANILNIFAKVLLSLIIVMPIFGALGVFPPPTPEMYNTPEAYAFIMALMGSGYLMPILGVTFALAFVCLWTRREALAALLLLPLTVNIFAFHLVLDGGMFTPGAVMADVLAVLNLYFVWQQRAVYSSLYVR